MAKEQRQKFIKPEIQKVLSLFKNDARKGEAVAGTARKQIERQIGKSIISEKNFLKSNSKKKIKS